MDRPNVTEPGVTILHGDALKLDLPDDSVDLVVTSPPYFGLRSYQDGGEHYGGQIGAEATPAEFVDALIAATAEMMRVVKPSGSIWVNLGDKYASGGRGAYDLDPGRREVAVGRPKDGMRPKSLIGIPWRYAIRCIDELGLILRAEVIWSKPNGLPESVTDRVRRSHEQWFHFTLEPRYYSAVDEVREEYEQNAHAASMRRTGQRVLTKHDSDRAHGPLGRASDAGVKPGYENPLGKLPGSVWTIPTEPLRVPDHLGIDHFAAFPTEWPRRIIQGWSPEGGTVLDPFGGTGTTALVAHALGRHGISNDMSSDYCRLARWRTSDPKQQAKAARREFKPAPEQVAGQVELFDLGEESA